MDVSSEFAGAPLGDSRLTKRAVSIVDRLAADPDRSFPTLIDDDGELEALYRFVNNERVEPEALLERHYQATAARASVESRVIVAHDTTGFSFGGEVPRSGLGRIKTGGQGFYLHAALVIGETTGAPLGLIGMLPVFRDGPPIPKKDRHTKQHDRVREFARWEELTELAGIRLAGCRAVHVMDREADAYPLFCQLTANGQDFVIRSKDDRILEVPRGNDRLGKKKQPRLLYEAISQGKFILSREVDLSTKRPDRMGRLRKTLGRMTRTASLEVKVTHVEVRHPPYTAGKSRRESVLPRAVPLNVVHVYEVGVPKGQQPIDWLLLTNLPISTSAEVECVIDCYRRRWLIEEYFKAIKTGCAYEKRQLESKHALLNALALFVPIAWRLLVLRYLAREMPDRDAATVLSERQLRILKARNKVELSEPPTVREAMLAVAAEGGHIKNNGNPGWQVLGRGYEKLLYMELGYVLRDAERHQ
jgi:hypothetical protein